MITKKITYKDYNGNEVTDEFHFNLSRAEVANMELSLNGGIEQTIRRLTMEKDNAKIVEMFQDMIKKSVGKKSADGKKFIKSEEILNDLIQTEAYSELYIELISDSKAAAAFVNGITSSVRAATPKVVK